LTKWQRHRQQLANGRETTLVVSCGLECSALAPLAHRFESLIARVRGKALLVCDDACC